MAEWIICSKCGGMNRLYRYATSIKCYACEEWIALDKKDKQRLREAFAKGISRKPEEDPYEKQIFKSLGLSASEGKYIYVDEKSVIFRFPLKVTLDFSAGGKRVFLDHEDKNDLYERITQFWEDALFKGGFEIQNMVDEVNEVEFYKGISKEEEAKQAVRWLVEFKRRFEF